MSIQKSQIILTKHAINRGKQRFVTQDRIERTLMYPEKSIELEEGKTKFICTIDGRQFQVIGTFLPKENKWLVISAWVRGEEDSKPILEQAVLFFTKAIWGVISSFFSIVVLLLKRLFAKNKK